MRLTIVVTALLGMFAHALPAFAQTVAETEPNDTPATADTAYLGGKATGDTGHPESEGDQYDYWVVLAAAGDTIHVDVDACPSCVDADIRIALLAADGVTVLATGQPWDGNDDHLTFVATAAGPYFIRVTGTIYGSPPYTLNFTPPPPCPAEPAEPNNTTATATNLSPPADVPAPWCPNGDVDMYRVQMTAGMVLEFWVSNALTNTYVEPKLRLLDGNGTLIGDEVFYGGAYPNRHLLYQAESDGPLYIAPSTWRGGLNDSYELHVRTHAAPSPELTLARAGRELIRPGQVLTAQERVYLDALGNKNGSFDVGDFRQFWQLQRGVAEWW